MAVLSEIWIYPIKSLPGIRLNSAKINRRGLAWDRHWMLVDDRGVFVSQRRKPRMVLFTLRRDHDNLQVSFPGKRDLQVGLQENSGERLQVSVWHDSVNAEVISAKADRWFSDCLGDSLRLVRMPGDVKRQVDQAYAQPDDQTGFADGFPFLLLGEASLDDLNIRIGNAQHYMTVQRFRPNLVISGIAPYAEDQWQAVRIGDIEFRVVKPCSRCVITTVDPLSAEKSAEPLLTLGRYRREGNKVFFGQNLIHDGEGRIKQGDDLKVLS